MSYPCKSCSCFFLTEADLKSHRRAFPEEDHAERFKKLHKRLDSGGGDVVGWRKSKWKDGSEWCFASDEPEIASACRLNGKVSMGGFDVKIDPTGKYLRRTRSRGF